MHAESQLHLLSSRLDILERQNRRLKYIVLAAICCSSICFLVGFAPKPEPEKVVIAKDFQLVDDKGGIRARLYFNNRGPILGFWDSANKHRVTLSLRDEQPYFVLADGSTKERMMAGSNAESTFLKLFDAKERLLWQAPVASEPAAKSK